MRKEAYTGELPATDLGRIKLGAQSSQDRVVAVKQLL